MGRWFLLGAGVLFVLFFGLVVFGNADGWRNHNRTEVGQVVTTSDGETMVVFDDGGGWNGPPVGFFFVPVFWIFLIGGAILFFRGNRWKVGPPSFDGQQAWFNDWHRRAHENELNDNTSQQSEA